jgi:hypothetical protein
MRLSPTFMSVHHGNVHDFVAEPHPYLSSARRRRSSVGTRLNPAFSSARADAAFATSQAETIRFKLPLPESGTR